MKGKMVGYIVSRRVTVMALCLLAAFAAMAQVRVEGTVSESDTGESLVGATVMLRGSDGKIKRYASTGTDGRFSVSVPSIAGAKLEVSMIGYAKKSVPVDSITLPVDVVLEPQALKLKEVAVKAARIRENGDTVTYDVTSFSRKQDKSIGDVINRMPGLEVDKSGKIQYQGTDINKFYIEGNDLLGGKYGIATKNIDHEDVGAVEVLENHQPMQVLRGLSFSDQAALNLKMKKRAKATLVAHGNAGGGWSVQPQGALWQGDIFTMMLSGGYQMLTTFSANNTGRSLNEQLVDFTVQHTGDNISGYLGLSVPSAPGLKRNRTLMNRSWMLSSSHLWKNKRGGEFKAQLDYINDRISAQASSVTTYFLDSGDKVITESRQGLSHTDALSGKFSYEANEKSYFLNNTLSVNISWNDLSLLTAGTIANGQRTRTPQYDVANALKVIKKFGGRHLVTFSSINKWQSLPERLTVERDGAVYGQRVGQHAFFTDERASYGLVIKRVLLSLEGGISGYVRSLSSDVYGMANASWDTWNDLTTDYFRLFVSPKLDWNRRKIEMSLSVPLNFYTYFFSAGMKNRSEVFAAPQLTARWKITPRMDLTLRGSARRSPASLHNIHTGMMLTDYRTLQAGVDDYYTSSGQSVSLSYQYRYPRIGVFVNARAAHNWNKSKMGSRQDFAGDYIIYSYGSRPSRSQSTDFMASVNKSLDFMNGTVGVTALYSINRNNMLSQGESVDYDNRMLMLSPHVDGAISSWLNWRYSFSFTRSSLCMSAMQRQHTDNYLHSLSLDVTPGSKVRGSVGGEYYRNAIGPHRYKNMVMLDAKITYSISKRIEVTASATNLLDRRRYAYTQYGTLSSIGRSSALRGREFLISIYLKK